MDKINRFKINAEVTMVFGEKDYIYLYNFTIESRESNSAVIADIAKDHILQRKEIWENRISLYRIHIIAVNEKQPYNATEFDATFSEEDYMDVLVISHPEIGRSTCKLTDSFYDSADFECICDCDECYKNGVFCK